MLENDFIRVISVSSDRYFSSVISSSEYSKFSHKIEKACSSVSDFSSDFLIAICSQQKSRCSALIGSFGIASMIASIKKCKEPVKLWCSSCDLLPMIFSNAEASSFK